MIEIDKWELAIDEFKETIQEELFFESFESIELVETLTCGKGYQVCAGLCIPEEMNCFCPAGKRPEPAQWSNWHPIPTRPPMSTYSVEDDFVLDTQTCLIWQRSVPQQLFDFHDATTHCAELELSGYDDWRLPTIVELQSILDRSRTNPTINTLAFPDSLPVEEENWYWTQTTVARDMSFAWAVGFLYGVSSPSSITTDLLVRCVR